MPSCPSRGSRPGSLQKHRRRESVPAEPAPLHHSASARSCGLRSSGVRCAFLYLQCNHFEFFALYNLRSWGSALRTAKQLNCAERTLCPAGGTKDNDGDVLDHEMRTL